MNFFSDALRLTSPHKYVLLGGALLIGLCAGAFLLYAPKYDIPATKTQEKTSKITLLGHNGTLTVSCDCPPYLIVQKPRNIKFHVDLKLEPELSAKHEPAKLNETIELMAEAKGASLEPQWSNIGVALNIASGLQAGKDIWLELRPKDSDFSEVELRFEDYLENVGELEDVARFNWSFPVRAPLLRLLQPVLYSLLIFLLALVLLYSADRKYRLLRAEEEQRIQAARTNAEQNPNQVSPAWELAGANLQRYFTRNLAQVRQVFFVSVGVMLVGFSFVLYGVYKQTASPEATRATWIASISGIITQFIGATFMLIYRSTMAQANEFVSVLDRINTVGIAMKVLDQIQDSDPGKNSARQQLISLLLTSKSAGPSASQHEAKAASDSKELASH